jgi:hypothetical protein
MSPPTQLPLTPSTLPRQDDTLQPSAPTPSINLAQPRVEELWYCAKTDRIVNSASLDAYVGHYRRGLERVIPESKSRWGVALCSPLIHVFMFVAIALIISKFPLRLEHLQHHELCPATESVKIVFAQFDQILLQHVRPSILLYAALLDFYRDIVASA